MAEQPIQTTPAGGQHRRAGSGVYSKGQKKIEQILKVAIVLFYEQGSVGFSMRKLATRMGVKISAIQHYFPNRTDLMCAVAAYYKNDFLNMQQKIITKDYQNDLQRLDAYLEFLVDDSAPHAAHVQLALVAEALSSTPKMAPDIEDGFKTHIEHICQVLKPLTPQLSNIQRKNRATLIAAASDGLEIYYADKPSVAPRFDTLAEDARAYLRQIALMP